MSRATAGVASCFRMMWMSRLMPISIGNPGATREAKQFTGFWRIGQFDEAAGLGLRCLSRCAAVPPLRQARVGLECRRDRDARGLPERARAQDLAPRWQRRE